MGPDRQMHWDRVWAERAPDSVSWFEATPRHSLELIEMVGLSREAALIDVGAGASALVDGLLAAGYRDLTALDLSAAALEVARARLGASASMVRWLVGDVLSTELPSDAADLWHDRAVFHFLTNPLDRLRYATTLRRTLRRGGHVVLASFAPDGPARCSGLEVLRYGAADLSTALGPGFECVAERRVMHCTPGGQDQSFTYVLLRFAPRSRIPEDSE